MTSDMYYTCHTEVTWGRIGYSPPVSKLYPARGSVKSESIGWSKLRPPPVTPLPGIGAATYVLERRPGKSGPPWGVPPPSIPTQLRADSDVTPAAIPLILQLRTLGIPPSSAGSPETLDPSPSSIYFRSHPTSHLAHGMAGIPCQPSSPCFSIGRPVQRVW